MKPHTATPREPREFFRGVWIGSGELVPPWFVRWFVPKQRVSFSTESIPITDTVWIVKDHFEFASGESINRQMFAELVAPDRIHVTADDMPLGADIALTDRGFKFTKYRLLASYRGRTYEMRVTDECHLDSSGFLHDLIQMYFWGVRVAVLHLGPVGRVA